MLINTEKSNERSGYTKLWNIMKENQFLRREYTDHKKTQRNETTGTCG